MPIALVLVAVALGSVLFHLLTPWWFTPIASNWQYIDARSPSRSGSPASLSPPSSCSWPTASCGSGTRRDGRRPMSPRASGLSGGLAASPPWASWPCWRRGLPSGGSSSPCRAARPSSRSWGQQWQWSFRLPGPGGRLGTSDARFISAENPLGLNPGDPHGRDNVLIMGDDLHLPVGRPVKALLRLHRRRAQFLRARVQGKDGPHAGPSLVLSGSRPPGSGRSRFSAPGSAASAIRRCAATS